MTPEIPELFDAFGHNSLQLNTFISVGILLQYFSRKLLQFKWSKTVLNLVMSRFISKTEFWSAAITKQLHITLP